MTEAEFDAAFARLPANGWLTRPEAECLVRWAEQTTGRIVEIGTYYGRSAMLLGQMGRILWCVDPWDNHFDDTVPGEEIYRQFRENVAALPNVLVKRCRVEDWEPVPAGFVYCDGDHTEDGTRRQISKALACGPKVIAVHDVDERGGGLPIKQAATEMLGEWAEKVETLAVWRVKA